MSEIKHLLHIAAPREKVYEAITTIKGLSGWWTTQTTGECKPGAIIQLRFGTLGNDMKVISQKKNEWVLWECMAGPDDWLGTRLTFQLSESAGKTLVRFAHAGWKNRPARQTPPQGLRYRLLCRRRQRASARLR